MKESKEDEILSVKMKPSSWDVLTLCCWLQLPEQHSIAEVHPSFLRAQTQSPVQSKPTSLLVHVPAVSFRPVTALRKRELLSTFFASADGWCSQIPLQQSPNVSQPFPNWTHVGVPGVATVVVVAAVAATVVAAAAVVEVATVVEMVSSVGAQWWLPWSLCHVQSAWSLHSLLPKFAHENSVGAWEGPFVGVFVGIAFWVHAMIT